VNLTAAALAKGGSIPISSREVKTASSADIFASILAYHWRVMLYSGMMYEP
jgi:hypothetical protein